MRTQLFERLKSAQQRDLLPAVVAYNRIDGPGSSLDLREFQQSFWSMPHIPADFDSDPAAEWTSKLPRTVGITIDVGTRIVARPLEDDLIGVRSGEYRTETIARTGEVIPVKENWLLKILELFGLSGVIFVLHNLRPGIQSSGLGGSAAATVGVCILANELAGRPLSSVQLVSLASRIEQDFGVSLTGTQEQSNTVYGGVVDYVWFPWGIPGKPDTGYGESVRYELIRPESYQELQQRIAIFHTGQTRASSDVNAAWLEKLKTADGYRLHKLKLGLAYQFREGLRLRKWADAVSATRRYQEIRTELCPNYMDGAAEILGFAEQRGAAAFPLGAGGGGAVLIFAPDSSSLALLRNDLSSVYRELQIKIMPKGHQLINLPLERTDQ
jgi:D-glycero-alpha-D-manno-heptose-7-phosphate kinase